MTLLHIPQLLTRDQLSSIAPRLNAADWTDGRATAGHQGRTVKHNQQLAEHSPLAQELRQLILGKLERHPQFIGATLPDRVYPPLFNRYADTMHFGAHIDNAIRLLPGSDVKIRTDLSATLFLSDPHDYDGGELLIEDALHPQAFKLPAGDLIVYPTTRIHSVAPVTRGVRYASFFWIQSMIRDALQREILFSLDQSVQQLQAMSPPPNVCLNLTGCYHNLLRLWSDC
jgi:PKHD-type hydroxylase